MKQTCFIMGNNCEILSVALVPILGFIVSFSYWFGHDKLIYDASRGELFSYVVQNLNVENYRIDYFLQNCTNTLSQYTNSDYFFENKLEINKTLSCYGLENNCDNYFSLLIFDRINFDSMIVIIIGTVYIFSLLIIILMLIIYNKTRRNYTNLN